MAVVVIGGSHQLDDYQGSTRWSGGQPEVVNRRCRCCGRMASTVCTIILSEREIDIMKRERAINEAYLVGILGQEHLVGIWCRRNDPLQPFLLAPIGVTPAIPRLGISSSLSTSAYSIHHERGRPTGFSADRRIRFTLV
ncbi:hypothetical protein LXL04_020574 [Taraxacum kok-saghyz]